MMNERNRPVTFVLGLSVVAAIVQSAIVGRQVQVPDKDPALKSMVYRVGVPDANGKIHDDVFWVPATQQFTASRITVMNGGRPYSTWTFNMLLQRSNCKVANTPISSLQNCRVDGSQPQQQVCHVNLGWQEGDYSTMETETFCSKPRK